MQAMVRAFLYIGLGRPKPAVDERASFAPKLLGMVINPSAAMLRIPRSYNLPSMR
jgi:hypothetical protein